ncbi:MAG: hypothetical protein ACOYMV_09205 [Verrucomicrobiia bacterium]|jgi:hypothetical protein
MNLTKAIRNLEHQARKAEQFAKVEQAKADRLREKLENIQKLVGILGSEVAPKAPKARRGRRKGKMSAAGRARIAAAQKKRWAAWKAKHQGSAKKGKKAVRKAKRKISPEGRARIVAAVKARWARQKAAK